MAQLTIKEFASVVQRSGLVSKPQLTAAYAVWKSAASAQATATDDDPCRSFANFLVLRELLSEWQTENLLAGKSQGFFIGRYKLLRHLGTGGMSSVYLAQHDLIPRQVAIKILPSSKASDTMLADRFAREVRATARLNHPNIVRAFDTGTQETFHYLVMEYIAGSDLKQLVKNKGPLPLAMAANFVAQVACGLQHAHANGLVHRDIKPANLVVNKHGIVKILDLGLARLDDAETAALTQAMPEKIMGTADYLAPEQALNCHTADHRADIYSLGCTFYYLLTSHAVFTKGTLPQRIAMHQSERPKDVRASRTDCPHALAEICMRMLAKSPDDRYQTSAEIAVRLYRWLVRNGYGQMLAKSPGFAQLSAWETNSPPLPTAKATPNAQSPANSLAAVAAELQADARATENATTGNRRAVAETKARTSAGNGTPGSVPNPPLSTQSSSNPPAIPVPRAQATLGHRSRTRATRTPIWLWVLLASATVACIFLGIALILQNR